MKKLLIIGLLISCLTFAFAGSTLAGSFYADYMAGEWDGESEKDDISAGIVGFEQDFDRFKLGIEYTDSKWEKWDEGIDFDYTGFDLKFGYQLTDQVALIAGYHRYDFKPDKSKSSVTDEGYTYTAYFADAKIDGIMIGIDADFPITDKISFNSSFSFSPDGKYKDKYSSEAKLYDEDDYEDWSSDIDIITAKVKFNYAVIDNLALSLGYHYTQYKFDDGRLDFSGFTTGLTYRFSGLSQPSQTTSVKKKANDNQPTTKTLVLKNDFHTTECTLTVNHSGIVKIGDVIRLTAEQVKDVKNALCGPYVAPADGELGIRPTWHKLGDKEVKLQELVMYDSNKRIVGASLTITAIQ